MKSYSLRSGSGIHHRTYFLLFFLLLLFSGCFHNYYKVVEKKTPDESDLKVMQSANKFVVLHSDDHLWYITDVKIANGNLSGVLLKIDPVKYDFIYPYHSGSNRYLRNKKVDQSHIVNEIHIFVNKSLALKDSVKIPVESINKIDIYDKNRAATIASYTISTIGVVTAAILVAAVIAVATEPKPAPKPVQTNGNGSSCPFVYTTDGEEYNFAGEIFGGALYPKLERDDYLALPQLKAANNNYQLFLNNQAREIQSINLTELCVVDHPVNTNILLDKYGKIYTTSDIKEPVSATDSKGRSQLDKISKADGLTYYDVPVTREEQTTDELLLTFAKPQKCDGGKLILRLRNSLLVDYSYEKYVALFGHKWDKWQAKINQKSSEELNQWSMNQMIPLSVYIQKRGEWKLVDNILPSGPYAFRENILSINLEGIESSEVKLKLSTGKLFWEIDRIGMDFTPDYVSQKTVVKPYRATDQNSEDVLAKILNDDSIYLTQPEIGNEVVVDFHEPAINQGLMRSVFLHSKGYYSILGNDNHGKSLLFLQKFKKPESFTQFVQDNYFEILGASKN